MRIEFGQRLLATLAFICALIMCLGFIPILSLAEDQADQYWNACYERKLSEWPPDIPPDVGYNSTARNTCRREQIQLAPPLGKLLLPYLPGLLAIWVSWLFDLRRFRLTADAFPRKTYNGLIGLSFLAVAACAYWTWGVSYLSYPLEAGARATPNPLVIFLPTFALLGFPLMPLLINALIAPNGISATPKSVKVAIGLMLASPVIGIVTFMLAH